MPTKNICANTVITVEEMAAQAWTEGRRQFVESKRVPNQRYELGDAYEEFLADMNFAQRQEYWRKTAASVPHSSNAYFVTVPEFYELLETRLKQTLVQRAIDRHCGPKFDQ